MLFLQLKPPYMYVEPKKGYANASTKHYWPNSKTTQIYEVSKELHDRLLLLSEQMKIAYNRKKKLKPVLEENQAIQESDVRKK